MKNLENAAKLLSFVSDDLRQALNLGNNVESILIIPLIKRTNELLNDIKSLNCAHDLDLEQKAV